ncbi:Tight Junction Protein Zo-1 [Manis pentadactyla]|nr:Tight Junction Protein Zo-1 [Manis pentadactyla]
MPLKKMADEACEFPGTWAFWGHRKSLRGLVVWKVLGPIGRAVDGSGQQRGWTRNTEQNISKRIVRIWMSSPAPQETWEPQTFAAIQAFRLEMATTGTRGAHLEMRDSRPTVTAAASQSTSLLSLSYSFSQRLHYPGRSALFLPHTLRVHGKSHTFYISIVFNPKSPLANTKMIKAALKRKRKGIF